MDRQAWLDSFFDELEKIGFSAKIPRGRHIEFPGKLSKPVMHGDETAIPLRLLPGAGRGKWSKATETAGARAR